MKKTILLTILFTILLVAVTRLSKAQTLINEQYASSVIAFSSEYGTSPGNYSATQALGMHNAYPNCGDNVLAWLSASAEGQREFLVLGFATPQPVNTIRIYQNVAAGAVDTVYLRNASNGLWNQVYVATAAAGPCAAMLEIRIPTTGYNVDAIRIAINSPAVPYWNEIDAVSIANFDRMVYEWQQYADSVIAFSSEYTPSPGGYSASKALGPPDADGCGSHANAWASLTANDQREFLVLYYAYPSKSNRVTIIQQTDPGAVDSVYLRDAATGIWHQIYTATGMSKPCPLYRVLEINFTQTTYNVDAIRISLNSVAANAYWNEIDAVALQSTLSPTAKLTAQTGPWSSGSSWVGGMVPASTDTAIIGTGHNITVDAHHALKSLFINQGGTLTINANSLSLGPNGGGKEQLQVQGAVNISGGILRVNGSIEFQTESSLTMSGGEIIVDGNDGTSLGSVADGLHLFDLKAGMSSFSVTAGTFTIIDPQYHASGQAIAGNYTCGPATILKIGNGSSSTSSNNTNGFGGNSAYPGFGNLVVDAVTDAGNRHFTTGSGLSLSGNCTVTTGKFSPAASVTIGGDLTVMTGTTLQKIGGNLRTNGNLINNGTITVAGGNFSVVNNFTNNTGAVYMVMDGSYTSFGDDLINNGAFTSGWLFMSNDFATSSNEQSIGGTGTFIVYGLEPHNSHINGVSLQVPMTVERTFFPLTGKLFLGNNDLTVNDFSYGSPGNNAYIVLNGTGKLINNNVNTDARLFPVGTTASYTPVVIDNGSGHNFSVSVKSTFTFPPNNSAIVNREWNITDITGGAVSADITFQWNAADEDGSFNRSLCHVGHHNGTSWETISGNAAAGGTDPYSRTATGVSAFSPFAIGSGGALPVTLLNFAGNKCNNAICLLWTTESEQNLSHFELERSNTGINFIRLMTVIALNQPGKHTYTNTDISPINGFNYYRLKIVNTDGSFSYSSIIKIDMSKPSLVSFQPNPATDRIVIKGMEGNTQIRIIDMNGKQVLTQDTQRSIEEIHIGALSTGVYMIQLVNELGTTTMKLLKQ